jgi:hypothetical protein
MVGEVDVEIFWHNLMSTDYPKALKKNLTILFCYLKGYKKRLK